MAFLTTFLAVAAAAVLVHKLLGAHAIHSHLWACAGRTNTTRQARFERLARYFDQRRHLAWPLGPGDVVTFDFGIARTNPGAVDIELPPGSGWYSIRHRHSSAAACSAITTLKGQWWIEGMAKRRPGPAPPERPGNWITFGREGRRDVFAVARFETADAEPRRMDHIVCSVVQDAEVYFSLCETPAWVKLAYAATKPIPGSREWLINTVLWIQIRGIFSRHDMLEDRGSIKFPNLFLFPPRWAFVLQERSRLVIARASVTGSYVLGRCLLGMRASYPEYEPQYYTLEKEEKGAEEKRTVAFGKHAK